jgi:hypothetical protein
MEIKSYLLAQWLTESRFSKTKFGFPIEIRSLMSSRHRGSGETWVVCSLETFGSQVIWQYKMDLFPVAVSIRHLLISIRHSKAQYFNY